MTAKPVAVISGGSGYLGSALVTALRSNGWIALSLSLHPKEIDCAYQCDITDERDVIQTVEKIIKTYGHISACIHAASPTIKRAPLLTISTASFDEAMATAARGAFMLAKATTPHMGEDSAFIGITSQATDEGALPSMGAYIPAKYALEGVLRVIAQEQKHLRVYAIAPGFMAGGLNQDVPEAVRTFLQKKPDSGFCTAQEVADLIAQLCVGISVRPSGSRISIPGTDIRPL